MKKVLYVFCMVLISSCKFNIKSGWDENDKKDFLDKRYWYHSYEQGRLTDSFYNNLNNQSKRDSFFILSHYNNEKRDSVLKAIDQLKQ